MNKIILVFFILLSYESFAQNHLNTLNSKNDFDKFAGLPLSEKYGQVSALKLVYELKTQKIYFINSKYFKYHHEFCGRELNDEIELKYFNKINYSNDPKRKYLLANINYFKSLDVYALEISPVDLMTKEDILLLQSVVSNATYISDSLHLLLNSARLQELKTKFEHKIPILNPSDIYKNLNYQAIGKHKNCGILHFVNDLDSEKENLNPMNIAVINETPLYLPTVSGIIVTEFQTPLSHLSILGQNRKIPIAAYKQAFQDSILLKLNHKKVCLEVLSDTFKIKLVDRIKPTTQTQRQLNLKFDLSVDSLINIEDIDQKSFKFVGNKAANFSILYKLSQKHDFEVPECAFSIPFYFYEQHLINAQIKQQIDSLLEHKNSLNGDSLKLALETIRKAIKKTALDSILLKSINTKIEAHGEYTRFRFRSSTNAEDAKGFSGAGLYTSKTGVLNAEKKTIEKAIKKVWASLWSYEAFSERKYYNINHKDAYMGILVHRAFPNEEVNGVAITKNLYRPDSYGFVVNAQLGNESVVKPEQGVINDQFICYPAHTNMIYENKSTVDILTQSNLNNNKLVMSVEEIQNLANKLDLVKKYFFSHTFSSKPYIEFGLDVEFKLDGKDRKLYFKQVRLYND